MMIGIMGAMQQEVDCIRAQMTEISEVSHGSRQYYLGKLNEIDVVLVFSRWGKVAAAATTTALITEFKINQLIFTGVAGAASPVLNIGDIVVSSQLYQHDMDARPLLPRYEIPLTGITFFKADQALIAKATSAAIAVLKTSKETFPATTITNFKLDAPKCLQGIIASGDKFIASKEQTEAILREKPETIAVEMEGAAVAQVCNDYQIPFVVIRTISDRADHEAHIDFPKFIEEVAKHYSEHIIRHMFSR